MNEALRDWVTNVARHLLHASAPSPGPHPYPAMVRDFQSRDRRRDPRADAGGRRPAAGRRWSPASAAAPTPSACSIRSSTTRASRSIGVEAAGHGLDTDKHAASHDRRPAGRAARQPHLSAAGRRRPDPRGAFDLGRARLSRHRPRAFLAARHRPRRIPCRDRRGGAGRLPALHRSSKASSRRWNRPTRSPM